jgi:hypothetical protein
LCDKPSEPGRVVGIDGVSLGESESRRRNTYRCVQTAALNLMAQSWLMCPPPYAASGGQRRVAAEAGGVATWRSPELASVFAVELGRTVVSDLVTHGRDVVHAGHEQ